MAVGVLDPRRGTIWQTSPLTENEIARQREIARALIEANSSSAPVAHWTQGAARVLGALGGVVKERRADAASEENAAYNSDILNGLLGGSAPVESPSMPTTTGAGEELAATSPAPAGQFDEVAPRLIADLSKDFGLSPEQAAGVVGQLGHESAGFGTLQEVKPLVPGSRGGFGYAQWTGPRRRAFEEWATQNGLDPTSYDANYGFLRHELANTPEGKALEAVRSAPDALTAGRAFTDTFLRPGIPGYDSRDQWTQRALAFAKPQQEVAAATPEAAIEAVAPSGYVDPMVSAPNAQAALAPELPAPVEVAPPPAVAEAPQRVAQAMAAPQQTGGINPAILRALTDPRATPQTQAVARALMQQQMAREEAAREQQSWIARQQYEREMQANDPLRQLQIQKAQIEVNSANQPQRQPLINAGNGAIYDPNQGSWIQAPNTGQEKTPDAVRALEIRAERAGLKPGTQEYNQFMLSGGGGGTSLSVGPNGEISFQQGGAFKPTEAQSKDSFFSTRLQSATPTIDKFESALLSLPEAAAGAIPFNLGRYAQTEEYQLAKDAGDDFVAAYLRKDSGAALTKEEKAEYGNLLLPQPGDKAAVVEAKRRRRQVAIAAINSGLPVAAVDNVVRALESVPGATEPAKTSNEIQTDIPGVKIRRKN